MSQERLMRCSSQQFYPTTLSAQVSSASGTVRPRALAVLWSTW
jgi:hypothetical protein